METFRWLEWSIVENQEQNGYTQQPPPPSSGGALPVLSSLSFPIASVSYSFRLIQLKNEIEMNLDKIYRNWIRLCFVTDTLTVNVSVLLLSLASPDESSLVS